MSLREALTWLGPSFVKAGQVLASRPDIVREDYMNELCTLQDDVPSFPDDLVSFGIQLVRKHVVYPANLLLVWCFSCTHIVLGYE